MKKIFWLTGSCFFDVDENIVKELQKTYEIYWFVLLQKSSFYSKDYVEEFMRGSKIKGVVVKWPRLRSIESLLYFIKMSREIKREKYDIIYLNFLGLPYMFPVLNFMGVDKEKIVYACHDFVEHLNIKNRKITQCYKSFIFHHFYHFHLFSKTQQVLFSEKYKSKTFYAPLYLKGFGDPTVVKHPTDVIQFLFFGEIHRRKGLEYLIKAANILNKKYHGKFIIKICGYCDEKEYYENLVEDKACFEFNLHRIENKEIPNIFACADYLVLPYKDMTQSGPLLISYNYEVPVIASNHAGFREYIENGKNGFLFENENEESLAKVMSEIIEKRYDYSTIKHNLNLFVKNNISIEKIANKYKEGFDGIIAKCYE